MTTELSTTTYSRMLVSETMTCDRKCLPLEDFGFINNSDVDGIGNNGTVNNRSM